MCMYNKMKILISILLVMLSFKTYGQTNYFRVALDAGHGAHDFGAVYRTC